MKDVGWEGGGVWSCLPRRIGRLREGSEGV